MSLTNGTKIKGVPDDGCAKCMFSCGTCCTSWTAVLKIEGDQMIIDDNTYCFCIRGSPCPCLNCCCCEGPHTIVYKLKKQSDSVYVGDKSHSQWKGGCCASMCHNEGDKMYLKDGVWTFTGGKNPTTPPCFQGEGKFHMEKVGGAPPMENATMER